MHILISFDKHASMHRTHQNIRQALGPTNFMPLCCPFSLVSHLKASPCSEFQSNRLSQHHVSEIHSFDLRIESLFLFPTISLFEFEGFVSRA